ncbi:MAG: hypothetical protein KAS04_06685, partial [Candidatus Aenigmarchaeota archaeon]|nr:hypothetical protein [Candidatus Aenigmarchaeota archaeon]
MVGNFVKRGILIVPIFLLALLVLFPQGSGFYFPTLKFEVPIMESSFNDLGLFVRNESMNLDFNLTFDYPLPLGEDESVITAEIWRGGELVDTKTIPLKEYLEQYKIINNDRYIFKPIFFNYSASVMAINATYNATEFDYSVTQYRRAPFENEGVAEGTRNKWKVQGRVIQDSYSGLTINNRYCSGPWDFEGDGVTTVNTGAGSVAVPNIGVPGTTTLYRQGEARTCNRQAGVENCKRGGDSCVEQSECCSGICSMFLCSMSGLNDDCTCVGNPPQCGEGSNMYACSENSVYQNPCCLERGTIGFVCDDGKCVMEEYALVVNRQSWDEDSNGNTWWTTPTQDNAILYFEIGDIESIKDTDPPAAPLISLEWASAHAWKFETYVRPTQEVLRTKAFRMYPDDGARFVYYKLQGNEWNIREQNWSCLTGMFDNSNGVGNGCPLHISLSPAILSRPQDGWYKLEFYLYNDPWGRSKGGEGDEDGNSFGL